MLQNKRIILGVSGGIAAYKSAALASKLTQAGAQVKVVMTEEAKKFITPLTFQALTRERVYDDTFEEAEPDKVSHIDVADWADMIIIAPATANIIGKAANGIADDMLSTILLASLCPIYIAPAMNVNMYQHPAVLENMNVLKTRGCQFIEPGEGYLACGWIGKGRMTEPEDIIHYIETSVKKKSPFQGKKVLVTAGPTYEYVDPVRVFTNPSSGKMGFAVAAEASKMGADVTLITGPVHLESPSNVKRVDVISAQDMYDSVMEQYEQSDIVIKAAAVSDYRPIHVDSRKEKKQEGDVTIPMERTMDILAELGKRKENQLLVGFAAESHNLIEYALDKMDKKNLDIVVANNITSENAGFRSDTNQVLLIKRDQEPVELPLASKKSIAKEILAQLETLL
ncbi:bifunctional phosphopantothenoylcysteine decarboxylase/phosphopantothenate--cysteine ligase CoaBC [Alteribacillus iranensis]|uniref:Coenzyme A biosynthesis bifunctional protein CoaBC n=1 Tax=Alteribacillus iranensis TaxID=930128 RepID=A0A1I2A8U8_9BACI|nr:bifunctional phosphopantothenoylcysteine decarboxylase/phosphopantothenate--cysteine ligase CoaBC [Alteribacillus iranensis]SFE40159.1 phosphopantothenoylcysteine decarboxylase / phosphopantothenate--cysteine ligase [Alteribacillus iranensis]